MYLILSHTKNNNMIPYTIEEYNKFMADTVNAQNDALKYTERDENAAWNDGYWVGYLRNTMGAIANTDDKDIRIDVMNAFLQMYDFVQKNKYKQKWTFDKVANELS